MNEGSPKIDAGRTLMKPRTILLIACVAAALNGCGGAGEPPPGVGDNLHVDMTIGSSSPSGGELAVGFNFGRTVELEFSQCFGGAGADCAGGVLLFAAEDPGFATLVLDSPAESLFALPDGVEIEIEVTAADPETSLFIEGSNLDDVGDVAVLGTSPDLHKHGSWQLAIPADEEPADSYSFTFRLRSDDGFGPSQEYVVMLAPHEE